jgi:hypothetical protein
MASQQYPGRIVTLGETDQAIVTAIQRMLNARGCGPLDEDGVFGAATDAAVKLFQARFTDADGVPLVVDGKVGSITWAALFGADTVPGTDVATGPLLDGTLNVAESQVGVMEVPAGSNRGPQVDEYVRRVGCNPADQLPWCAAFVYYCFDESAKALGRSNPLVKTAGVLDHWAAAGQRGTPRISGEQATQNPDLIRPGHIFVIDTGGGHGHMGLVREVTGGTLVTIEGNTNDGGSREGVGVFQRNSRKIVSINKGFIDYGAS